MERGQWRAQESGFGAFRQRYGLRIVMILGVLGGIGSGKSTVTRMLVDEGASAVSADDVAHDVIQIEEMRQAIRSWMGDEVFLPDGRVDRAAVGRRVFSDPRGLKRLEALLHPEIRRRITKQVEEFRAQPETGDRILVLDVPLLAASPLRDLCDELVFVESSRQRRRERTAARGWSREEFERREASQCSTEEKRQLATRIIDNSDSLESTRAQVRELYDRLLSGKGARGRVAPSVPGGQHPDLPS